MFLFFFSFSMSLCVHLSFDHWHRSPYLHNIKFSELLAFCGYFLEMDKCWKIHWWFGRKLTEIVQSVHILHSSHWYCTLCSSKIVFLFVNVIALVFRNCSFVFIQQINVFYEFCRKINKILNVIFMETKTI